MHEPSQLPESRTTTTHGRGRPHGPQAARERADRTLRGLSRLLDSRPELLGVHPPADWAYDAVRWSA
jgi:hypothetical protein